MRVRAGILPKSGVRLRTLAVLAVGAAALSVLTGVAPAAQAAAAQQPVNNTNAPDPGVMLYQNNYYAFSTSGFGLYESRASSAAGPWGTPRNVLNTSAPIPSWIDTSQGTWAPDPIQIPTTGEFAVYFSDVLNTSANSGTTETAISGTRCEGVALSSSPDGPYTIQPRPITCLEGYGAYDDMLASPGTRPKGEGVIDGDVFLVNNSWDKDTNELFLVEKTQSGSGDATIRLVQLDMSTNGTSTIGDSSQILSAVPTGSNSSFVYADTVEAPSILPLSDGKFLLFVAHGNYSTCSYTTEYFTSSNPMSFSNSGGTTLQSQSQDSLCGPGSGSWTPAQSGSQYDWFFHAYGSGTAGGDRQMYADTMTIGSNDVPKLAAIAPVTAELPGAPALYDVGNGNFEVYATDATGALDEDYWNGSKWSGVHALDSGTTSTSPGITGKPSAIYDSFNGNVEVYATGTDGALKEDYWNGSSWSGLVNLGGDIVGSPSALVDSLSGKVEVYATGSAGDLEVDSWSPSGGWSGLTSLGTATQASTGAPDTLATSPAAVNDLSTGNTQVVAVGSAGDLLVDSWNPSSGWTGLTSVGGSLADATPSPLYDTETGNFEVYATGSAGDLQEAALIDTGWIGPNSLHGSIVGAPSALNDTASNNLEVYATGSAGDLQENVWTPSSSWRGLGTLNGSIEPGPTAVYDPKSTNMEVYATGTNGQLLEFYWNGSSWSAPQNLGGDITAQ